jgi:hypothetical protein
VTWLEATEVATTIRENSLVFPWLESVHVMAIALVLGTIAIIDLRLIGVAGVGFRTSRLMRAMLPITWTAFALATITGVLMFLSQPALYLRTTAFQIKLGLLLMAGVNMAVFHLLTARSLAGWDDSRATPPGAKLAGLLSLCLWIGIVFAGRFIGFTLDAFGGF